MHFPVYIDIAGVRIHAHLLFEGLAYATGLLALLWGRRRHGDSVSAPTRWSVVTAAVAGGAIGSKLMYLLEDPTATLQHLRDPVYLMGGKSIVGGLVGGLIAVELVKRYLGEKRSTGDLLAVPLALGIAIGRIGCFLTGLDDYTYGAPTQLPWGVDFGDGIRRHPTQLYETVFLLVFIPVLYWAGRNIARAHEALASGSQSWPRRFQPGDAFKLFMVGYFTFRLVCDTFKPYVHVALGLCSIQWICLLTLLYYVPDLRRWLTASNRATQEGEAAQEAKGGAF